MRGRSSADSAASTNAIPSVISKGVVTSVPDTPWSYSTGIRSTKRISCWARRACSSAVNGAAVKWLRIASASATAAGTCFGAAAAAGRLPKSASASALAAGPRCSWYSGASIPQ